MNNWSKKRDILAEKYGSDEAVKRATELLQAKDQTEEAFLGAQGILMLHGLL